VPWLCDGTWTTLHTSWQTMMLAAPGGANTYGESFFAALYEGELTDPDLFNYHHGAAGRVVGVRSATAAGCCGWS
jgi:hypothetical protein